MHTLVDTHCHLDFPEFASELAEVVARAEENGVKVMQTICTHITKFPQVLAVAEAYPNIYCSVGIHPHNVEGEPKVKAEEIIALTHNPKVIGIGETGLDYYYEHSPRELQKTSFIEHIKASRQTGLPLIVHTRDADDDTIDILKSEYRKGAFTGVIHCFSTGREIAEAALEIGFYISLSGILTFKKADELRAIVKDIPLDKLLVETDSPYLAPLPHRGKRNEPAFTLHTAECLAELKGIPLQELAKITTDNFYRLFSKPRAEAH
jgi:TatD DNase family protein